MRVVVLAAVTIVLLHWLWPRLITRLIRRSVVDAKERRVLHHAGEILGFGFFIAAVLMVIVFTSARDDRSIWDDETGIAALGVVGAVVYAYARLFSPNFYACFLWVSPDGTQFKEERLDLLWLSADTLQPMWVHVHNTGITAWTDYRMTLSFPEGFQLYEEHEEIPASRDWRWRSAGMDIWGGTLMLQRSQPLTVGEPHAIRFVVLTPNQPGQHYIRVAVIADGRLGQSETRIELRLLREVLAS